MKRTERGWAGHFICSHRCLFRRNTLLEHEDQKIVVSTVGLMRPYLAKDDCREFEQIGYNRYYETMAFPAALRGLYVEADCSRDAISFESPCTIDNYGDNSDNEANEMHEMVVDEISENMIAGKVENQISIGDLQFVAKHGTVAVWGKDGLEGELELSEAEDLVLWLQDTIAKEKNK